MTNSGDVTYCDRQGGIALAPIFSGWRLHGWWWWRCQPGGHRHKTTSSPLSVGGAKHHHRRRPPPAASGSNPHSPAACLPYAYKCAERGRLSEIAANAAPKRRGHQRGVNSRAALALQTPAVLGILIQKTRRSPLPIKLC
jgi:hypothetical protein